MNCLTVNKVVALIATHNRSSLLLNRSLVSIAHQLRLPDAIVVVNDGDDFELDISADIRNRLCSSIVHIMPNSQSKGAAGAWNTGINFISQTYGECFIAILDDDDYWEPEHLQLCEKVALNAHADAVISGLRFWRNGKLVERPLIENMKVTDFLIGNPGWQGSNTFVRLSKLVEAGGFCNGMLSVNDRYLAIKLLSLSKFNVAFTGQWTANWLCSTTPGSLSSPGSAEKVEGLRKFYSLFKTLMNEPQRNEFFLRAERLFTVSREVIINDLQAEMESR